MRRLRLGRPMATASINRELACLKRMFTVAGKGLVVLKGEIRALRWDQVDLKVGAIRLKSSDAKTGAYRIIPLSQALRTLFDTTTRYVSCPYVFVNPAKVEAWQADPQGGGPLLSRFRHQPCLCACRKADVANATFHDLRHTFVTNVRRAGINYFRIMAITGHKTMSVFKRYNTRYSTIDETDLRQAMRQMDTYLDTGCQDESASDA